MFVELVYDKRNFEGLPAGVDLENDDLSVDPMGAIAKLTLTIQHMQGELVELRELIKTQKP